MTRIDQLRRLYARIPQVPCKGLCEGSCGPISASRLELRLMQKRAKGKPAIGQRADGMCHHLVDGRCSIYRSRPTVCRLWGAVAGMPCPYGCVPAEGLLDDQQGMLILAQSLAIGGDDEHSRQHALAAMREIAEGRVRFTVREGGADVTLEFDD